MPVWCPCSSSYPILHCQEIVWYISFNISYGDAHYINSLTLHVEIKNRLDFQVGSYWLQIYFTDLTMNTTAMWSPQMCVSVVHWCTLDDKFKSGLAGFQNASPARHRRNQHHLMCHRFYFRDAKIICSREAGKSPLSAPWENVVFFFLYGCFSNGTICCCSWMLVNWITLHFALLTQSD